MNITSLVSENPIAKKLFAKIFRTFIADSKNHGVYVYIEGDKIEFKECKEDPIKEVGRLRSELLTFKMRTNDRI